MKNFILAAAVAITSVFSFTPPMQAASITVQTDNGNRVVAPGGRLIIRDRMHNRQRDRRHMRRERHRECRVEVKRYRHHGRLITKRVRVCENRY